MTAMYPIGMINQAHSGNRSQGRMKAAATRTKKMKPASEISRRASWGKGITAMRTVPIATRAKTGSRTRMEPEKPMGSADPCTCGSRRPSASGWDLEQLAHRFRERYR